MEPTEGGEGPTPVGGSCSVKGSPSPAQPGTVMEEDTSCITVSSGLSEGLRLEFFLEALEF